MVGFTAIAATAAVVSAGATVASSISSSKAQKKAADQAAATEEENARRAEENAEAWAAANEQQTAFNYAEATLDANITKDKTARDIAFLTSQKAYQGGVYDRAIGSTIADMTLKGDAITRTIGAQSELLLLRGDGIVRDAEDEIAALMGESAYQRGALGRKAAQTLADAASAVLAADTRTGFEVANLEASASELDTQSQASLRRAGIEKALGAAEQQRLRAQGERITGAARAQAGKAGVALSGSALDVMADQAGEAELAALAAKYQADITVDSYVEDARAKGVRAVQLRTQAGQAQIVGALDAVNTMATAEFTASELAAQAAEIGRQTTERVGTLERQRDTNIQAWAIEGTEKLAGLRTDLAGLWTAGADRVAGLDAERTNTLGNYDAQIETTKIQGDQQEAALRREAEQIKKKGEIDARNIRLTQLAQAADFRASAAARRESGNAAATAGYLSAGATILSTAGNLAKQFPETTSSLFGGSSGSSAAAGTSTYTVDPRT